MRTVELAPEESNATVEALQKAGFSVRHDPGQDMNFIVKTDTGAAVWGDVSEDSICLYQENMVSEFDGDDIESFTAAFAEIHAELEEDGFDCWDEPLAKNNGTSTDTGSDVTDEA
ncbi:hypothetical protein [Nesterenkonia rhizosphaerae]|uniref:Uncharacterized protein n=1 Tax=Nesterenkonia rhizosphaerae TaxID=1348272 RepID=A0ABP9FZV1_9MICC